MSSFWLAQTDGSVRNRLFGSADSFLENRTDGSVKPIIRSDTIFNKRKLWMKMIICARFARTFLGKWQCVLEKRDIIIFSFYSVHVPLVKNGRPNDGFCHHRATINFILVSILMCHLRFIAYTQKKSRDFTANISSSNTLVEMSSKKSHFSRLRAKRAMFAFWVDKS